MERMGWGFYLGGFEDWYDERGIVYAWNRDLNVLLHDDIVNCLFFYSILDVIELWNRYMKETVSTIEFMNRKAKWINKLILRIFFIVMYKNLMFIAEQSDSAEKSNYFLYLSDWIMKRKKKKQNLIRKMKTSNIFKNRNEWTRRKKKRKKKIFYSNRNQLFRIFFISLLLF